MFEPGAQPIVTVPKIHDGPRDPGVDPAVRREHALVSVHGEDLAHEELVRAEHDLVADPALQVHRTFADVLTRYRIARNRGQPSSANLSTSRPDTLPQ